MNVSGGVNPTSLSKGRDLDFAFGDGPELLHRQRLCDGVVDGPPGVHRLVRVLEDHLHAASEGAHAFPVDMGDVDQRAVVGQENLTAGGFHKTGQHASGRRLAAT